MIKPDIVPGVFYNVLDICGGGAHEIFREGQATKRATEKKGVPIVRGSDGSMAVVTKHGVGEPADVRVWDGEGRMVDVSVPPGEVVTQGPFTLSHVSLRRG